MSKSNLEKDLLSKRLVLKKISAITRWYYSINLVRYCIKNKNSSQIFEKIHENIFVAGCYNGSGIGVGTLFGEQIAIKASNEHTKEIETIEAKKKPTWLPPQPFLDLGVKARLMYERLRARSEIYSGSVARLLNFVWL